jgi:predicted ATPase
MTQQDEFFVLTGGPGSGKSTLLDAMAAAGYARSAEAGRGVIQDQLEIGGPALPWQEPSRFAELMLCWELRSYRLAQSQPRPVIFDRGVLDVIGYLRTIDLPVPAHMYRAAEQFRYNKRVFIAPPWPAIFKQDEERKQTVEDAARTYESMVTTYKEYDYELVEIPRVPVEQRVQFLLGHLTR